MMQKSQTVVPGAALTLLERCDAEIVAAQFSSDPAERFRHAHFAALRLAGAILEFRGRAKVRGQSGNVWQLLARYVPEFASWAEFFSGTARLRSSLDAGRLDLVDDARAEQVLRAAEDFRDLAQDELGLGFDPVAKLQPVRAS